MLEGNQHIRSPATLEEVGKVLTKHGICTIDTRSDPNLSIALSRGFHTANECMDYCLLHPDGAYPHISPETNSAKATGWHITHGMSSRYNSHREGFVFSNDEWFDIPFMPDFCQSMKDVYYSLFPYVEQIFNEVEKCTDIPSDWFKTTFGPFPQVSQWHLKRYVLDHSGDDDVVLPMHTDPSIISLVIHNKIGTNEGGMGLQYQHEESKQWTDIPYHGHGVITVFTGSILSLITGGKVPAVRHRVVYDEGTTSRMAVTLFVRPRPDATLCVPPSDNFQDVAIKPCTFDSWIHRVAKNYKTKKKNTANRHGSEKQGNDKNEKV